MELIGGSVRAVPEPEQLEFRHVDTIPCRPFPLTEHVLAVRLYAPHVPEPVT